MRVKVGTRIESKNPRRRRKRRRNLVANEKERAKEEANVRTRTRDEEEREARAKARARAWTPPAARPQEARKRNFSTTVARLERVKGARREVTSLIVY